MIRFLTYEEVLPLWQTLHPNHPNMRPTNGMRLLGGYDPDIHNYPAIFLGKEIEGKIVAVIGGHKSANGLYRSRGQFVLPDHRRRGYISELLYAQDDQARREDCSAIWGTPNHQCLPGCLKMGYTQISDFTHEGFADGPNCYVIKKVPAKH